MSVNIGGDQNDKSYRYKMPRLQAKVEGRGNGIKTAIPNMVDIARALHTDVEYPTKFFGIELGAQSKFDKKTDRAVVNGKHDAPVLQELLTKFIEMFILCPKCKLPELNWDVRQKSGLIKTDCRACGYNGPIKTVHKLASFILTHPPETKKKGAAEKPKEEEAESDGKPAEEKKEAEAPKEEEEEEAPAPAADENVEWFSDTSREAAALRKESELAEFRTGQKKSVDAILQSTTAKDGALDTPRTAMRAYLGGGDRSTSEITSELRRLQLARGFDDWERVNVLLQSMFDTSKPKTLPSQFKKQAKALKSLTTDGSSRLMLINAIGELLGVVAPKAISVLPHVLQTLYEADVLGEENIVSWYESPAEADRVSNKKVSSELRRHAEPLIDWFKNAEEDDDEEDD